MHTVRARHTKLLSVLGCAGYSELNYARAVAQQIVQADRHPATRAVGRLTQALGTTWLRSAAQSASDSLPYRLGKASQPANGAAPIFFSIQRSEERRVGKKWFSTC